MPSTDEASIEAWLSALRADSEPVPSAARQRLAERLIGPGVLAGSAGAVAARAGRGWLHSRRLAAAIALPVGAVAGAAGHAWWVGPRAPTVAVALAPPAASMPAPVSAKPPVVASSAPLEAVSTTTVSRSVGSRPTSAATLGAENAAQPSLERELQQLEQARSQLAEGHPLETLELLRQHRAAYRASSLEQEREALRVRALAAAGRDAEARASGEAFVRRFPKSPLRGAVERSIGAIP